MKRTRTIALILALAGIALLLIGLIAPVFLQETASTPSVGIIGGADTPTYLLILRSVAGGLFLWIAAIGAVMVVSAIGLLMVGRKK
jgi:Na+-transporting methylmalonyl-CoA/oxaloacetate decarboxylase beta subunit